MTIAPGRGLEFSHFFLSSSFQSTWKGNSNNKTWFSYDYEVLKGKNFCINTVKNPLETSRTAVSNYSVANVKVNTVSSYGDKGFALPVRQHSLSANIPHGWSFFPVCDEEPHCPTRTGEGKQLMFHEWAGTTLWPIHIYSLSFIQKGINNSTT